MLETEVTQPMWESIMGNNPSKFQGANLPVESVSWNDCQRFLTKLNKLGIAPVGSRFALPTEAQWEYACRAGTATPFFWGDSLNGDRANCNGRDPYGTDAKGKFIKKTVPVGSYVANPWGLLDMHGNVAEWCQDRCTVPSHVYMPPSDYPTDAVTDPRGPNAGCDRIARGAAGRTALSSAGRLTAVVAEGHFSAQLHWLSFCSCSCYRGNVARRKVPRKPTQLPQKNGRFLLTARKRGICEWSASTAFLIASVGVRPAVSMGSSEREQEEVISFAENN